MTVVTIPIAAGADDGYISHDQAPNAWPPVGGSGAVLTDATAAGIRVRKVRHGTFNFSQSSVGALIFDTSAIPDDATITAATLQVVVGVSNVQGSLAKTLDLEWYDFGAGIDDAGDWVENLVSASAGSVPFATWSAWADNATVNISLSNPTSINKSGETGIRIAHSSGDPGAGVQDNEVSFYAFENATFNEPRLVVTYTEAPQTLSLGHRAAAATVRGTDAEASGSVSLTIGQRASAVTGRGASALGSGSTTLGVGRKASGATVRGSSATASGAATLGVGRRAGAATTRGASASGTGSATLGVGRRAGAATPRGITASGTGTATLGVGRRAGAAVLYGIGPTSSLILSIGRKASGAVLRGASPLGAGSTTLGLALRVGAATIRGTSPLPTGVATLALSRRAGASTLYGVTVEGVLPQRIVGMTLAATARRGLTLAGTHERTISLAATVRRELTLEADIQ
jgi:hypothetical protein